MKDMDKITVGSKWMPIHGDKTCRVMGIVEGYVVARYKGAAPWLLHVNDWHKKFVQV